MCFFSLTFILQPISLIGLHIVIMHATIVKTEVRMSRNNLKLIFLALILFMFIFCLSACNTINGSMKLRYYLNGSGTYCVTDYDGSSDTVVIPLKHRNKAVTQIGSYAFYNCDHIKHVTIPDSVYNIGSHAFEGCTSLESITLPDNLSFIDPTAFNGCTSLESIALSEQVFETLFNSDFYSDNKGVFDLKKFKKIEITSGDYIPNQCFAGCIDLTEVILPDTLKYIPDSAFQGCVNLEKITIPNGVRSIGDKAFYSCLSLTEIVLPETIVTLGTDAFSYCYDLRSIVIPDGIYTLSSSFFMCTRLASVTIPRSVSTIQYFTFYGCESLKNITYEGTVLQWNAIYKEPGWNSHLDNCRVNCANGVISAAY